MNLCTIAHALLQLRDNLPRRINFRSCAARGEPAPPDRAILALRMRVNSTNKLDSNSGSPEQLLHLHVAPKRPCAERCREVTNTGLSWQGGRVPRRTIRAKSPRERRQYRKLTDMYRALAMGEEPENARSPKKIVKTGST